MIFKNRSKNCDGSGESKVGVGGNVDCSRIEAFLRLPSLPNRGKRRQSPREWLHRRISTSSSNVFSSRKESSLLIFLHEACAYYKEICALHSLAKGFRSLWIVKACVYAVKQRLRIHGCCQKQLKTRESTKITVLLRVDLAVYQIPAGKRLQSWSRRPFLAIPRRFLESTS